MISFSRTPDNPMQYARRHARDACNKNIASFFCIIKKYIISICYKHAKILLQRIIYLAPIVVSGCGPARKKHRKNALTWNSRQADTSSAKSRRHAGTVGIRIP